MQPWLTCLLNGQGTSRRAIFFGSTTLNRQPGAGGAARQTACPVGSHLPMTAYSCPYRRLSWLRMVFVVLAGWLKASQEARPSRSSHCLLRRSPSCACRGATCLVRDAAAVHF